MMKLLVFLLFIGYYECQQLAVYWGQDSAGGSGMILEKRLDDYCMNYEYDIIPVAFLDILFDLNNKDDYPGINLANHCNTSFPGYPDLLNCSKIGNQIKTCQDYGRKIILSLGGPSGVYGFSSTNEAEIFARRIWNLFLGGDSDLKPFKGASLDGVDFYIEAGTTEYYVDFIRAIRQLMLMDNSKSYIITGAPQCPYPDYKMGPAGKGTVLSDIPQEFDYLFVQFYSNWCNLENPAPFNSSITKWFEFAENTKVKYGSGPEILIGLLADPITTKYQTPKVVENVYEGLKTNPNLGGIMLWDASADTNNIIDGHPYSWHLKQFLRKPPEIIICYNFGLTTIIKKINYRWIGWAIIAVVLLGFVAVGYFVFKLRKSKMKKNDDLKYQPGHDL